MKKLELVFIVGFICAMLWIVADWLRPTPRAVKSGPPSAAHRAAPGPPSGKPAASTARSSGEAAAQRAAAKTVRSPFADQPGAFAIDPFAEKGPEAIAVFPEPPKLQLPSEDRDAQVRQAESE